jgi:hypothetical protein
MSFNQRYYGSREAATWLHFRELFIAVVSLSILPYLSRGTAQSLGHWAVIAPGVALSLALFGGFFIYLDSRLAYSNDPARQLLIAALLLTLVVGTGLNTWAVAAVWTKREPSQEAAVSKTSDLNDIAGSPDVIRFAEAAGQKKLPSVPNLNVMVPYIREMLSHTTCAATEDSTHLGITHDFECTRRPSRASRGPQCQFTWSLSPVYAGTALAIVKGRDDVVTKFKHQSGYGKLVLSSASEATAPYVGVAVVGCAGRAGKPPRQNLRVAFVLSTASQTTRYKSVFRTVGFDWIEPDYLPEPYIAELFSLTSLYKVTQLISSDKAKFPQTMTTGAHDVLFDRDAIQALRKVPRSSIRVGNRSDGQLGNSRGSCLLVAKTLGLTRDSVRAHVAPSAVTSDLSLADRSLVLLPPGNEPISLPCTLVSALATRSIKPVSNYPAEFSGATLHYRIAPEESRQDAQRAAYNIRAAALTLYLLGFDVKYDKAAVRAIGFWPRSEFTKTR